MACCLPPDNALIQPGVVILHVKLRFHHPYVSKYRLEFLYLSIRYTHIHIIIIIIIIIIHYPMYICLHGFKFDISNFIDIYSSNYSMAVSTEGLMIGYWNRTWVATPKERKRFQSPQMTNTAVTGYSTVTSQSDLRSMPVLIRNSRALLLRS